MTDTMVDVTVSDLLEVLGERVSFLFIVLLVFTYIYCTNYIHPTQRVAGMGDDDQKYDTDIGSRARLYLQSQETARRLDPFEREARAGLPDVDLARKAGVSVSSVRFWRRRREIRHKVGAARLSEAATAKALDLLGQPLEDVLQRVQSSEMGGDWSPPDFIIRTGIHYNKMMEQCHLLLVHGYSAEEIAEAHGYTVTTVQQAIATFIRYQEESRGG